MFYTEEISYTADRLGTLFLRFWDKVRPFFVGGNT